MQFVFILTENKTTEKNVFFFWFASPIKHADDTLTAVCRFHFIKQDIKSILPVLDVR